MGVGVLLLWFLRCSVCSFCLLQNPAGGILLHPGGCFLVLGVIGPSYTACPQLVQFFLLSDSCCVASCIIFSYSSLTLTFGDLA